MNRQAEKCFAIKISDERSGRTQSRSIAAVRAATAGKLSPPPSSVCREPTEDLRGLQPDRSELEACARGEGTAREGACRLRGVGYVDRCAGRIHRGNIRNQGHRQVVCPAMTAQRSLSDPESSV